MITIPCTRHGIAGTSDAELVDLAEAFARSQPEAAGELASLHFFDDRLWATWKNDQARDRFGPGLGRLWLDRKPDGSALNLSPSDEAYDFQEDVMNNAEAD